ncbi:MAG: protein prkA [Dehalococcoidia bacterium]|nr:protein prkA [Chloroflexota bacterium]
MKNSFDEAAMEASINQELTEGPGNTESKVSGHEILAGIKKESKEFQWEGTFEQYLEMVIADSSIVKLSHALVNESIKAPGVHRDLNGEPLYRLFDEKMFGLESALDKVARYFEAAAQRLEVRKRILLLLGPPASGKSSIIDIIKRGLEDYTKTESGSIYTIQGCPMQEDPLHLVTGSSRAQMHEDYGIYIEGELCFHCRFLLEHDYQGNPAEIPISRVTFSESRAKGIGYYLANNPNPPDPSVLVGSHNESKLDGDRQEVAARAFRLDGELNVANRGMMEFVEIFKADRTLLTTLLSLAQEQLIKMEKFGSVYADEVIVAHSNEGDFNTFATDPSSEALKDRIIAIKIPYNLRVSEEVKILQKMIGQSTVHDVHIAPLTLPVVSIFAILSRLESPTAQGMSLLDKVKLYDGGQVANFTHKDVLDMQRHHPNEGMGGISPRYILNRIGSVASAEARIVTPLAALDSMWHGLKENISLDDADILTYVDFISETVKEYNRLAVRELQIAFEESFHTNANSLFENYLKNIEAYCTKKDGDDRSRKVFSNERDMQELERAIRITARYKDSFRHEINIIVSRWKKNNVDYDYRSDPRLKAAIENRLLPAPRTLERALAKPRFARQRVEWKSRYDGILNRLVENYGYTKETGEDLMQYAVHTIKNRAVVRTPRNEGIEWLWPLYPQRDESTD